MLPQVFMCNFIDELRKNVGLLTDYNWFQSISQSNKIV